MLTIQNLEVQKDDKTIIKNLNLKMNTGEVHVIMGPNGSGKSTLGKVIAGHPEYALDTAQIFYDYHQRKIDLHTLAAHERSLHGIFLSFQYPIEIPGITNLSFLKSVYEAHCQFQGTEDKSSTDEHFIERLRPHLELLQMKESFLHRSVNTDFSGGEKKKNELLQMLLLNPRLAILDEVDSGLDIDSLKVVAEAVNHFKTKKNSVLLITHYQRLLDYIKPDVIHVMLKGKIVKTGNASLAKELEAKGYDWLKEEKNP